MAFDLAAMWRRSRNPRRRSITFRPIMAPAMLASDLYAAGYNPVILAWNEAIPDLIAEYERSLSALTTDGAAEIGAVLTRVESDIAIVLLSIRARLQRWASHAERIHRTRWASAVKAATGVEIGDMIGPVAVRETIGAAIERNVGLVRSVSEQARTRIGEAVFRGLTQRRPAREVAKEIRESVAMSRRRALNIASDQTVKITAALNRERRHEAGIDTWEWMSSHKVNYRPEHLARDGKRYSDDDPPEDMPGELPFCGCTSRAVLSLDD